MGDKFDVLPLVGLLLSHEGIENYRNLRPRPQFIPNLSSSFLPLSTRIFLPKMLKLVRSTVEQYRLICRKVRFGMFGRFGKGGSILNPLMASVRGSMAAPIRFSSLVIFPIIRSAQSKWRAI